MKKVVIIGVIVAVAAGLYVAMSRPEGKESTIEYVSVPVKRGSLKAEISCTGTVSPLVEVLVGSQVSGTIKALYADYETKVQKGQLIGLIDPDKFQAKVLQARADLEAARASLVKAEVTWADEVLNLRRSEALVAKGSVSQQEYDKAKARADAAQAQIGVDKAKVAQMEAKLNEADLELNYTRIIAPVNGVVISRNMDVGQTVTASFQTPVLFKIAEDLSKMQVYTNVDEADIGRVRLGQSAEFTVPAFPDQVFKASVMQIRNEPRIAQNVVTYNVVLDVNNDNLDLRPGMTASVQILISQVPDALIVPDQALRFAPKIPAAPESETAESQPDGRRVWKLEGPEKIAPVPVKVGVTGTQGVQVSAGALKPGDRVVVEEMSRKKKSSGLPGMGFRF